jgi:2'-5' RNA ligase
VDEALASLGFEPEQRQFAPHLTLGRVQRNAGVDDARALGAMIGQTQVGSLGSVPVTDLIFFQSTLRPTGAEYTPLGTFKLAGQRPSGVAS